MTTAEQATRQVENIIREMLTERFNDTFVFNPIIVIPRVDHDGDYYLPRVHCLRRRPSSTGSHMDPEAIRPPVVSVGKTRIPRNSHAFIRREIRVEGVGEKTGMDPRDLIRIAESLAEGSRCGTSRGSSGPRRPAPGSLRSRPPHLAGVVAVDRWLRTRCRRAAGLLARTGLLLARSGLPAGVCGPECVPSSILRGGTKRAGVEVWAACLLMSRPAGLAAPVS